MTVTMYLPLNRSSKGTKLIFVYSLRVTVIAPNIYGK